MSWENEFRQWFEQMDNDDDAPMWLFRGVPAESPEVDDVRATGEVVPHRPDRTGERWRELHIAGIATETAYTSWTSERSMAIEAAMSMSDDQSLGGRVAIFRVRFSEVADRCYMGREDEDEYLLEGRIDNVKLSLTEIEDVE